MVSDDGDKARTHTCPGYTGQHTYWVMCNKAAQQTVKDVDLSMFSQDKGEKNPTQVLFLRSESKTVFGQESLQCYDTSQSQ